MTKNRLCAGTGTAGLSRLERYELALREIAGKTDIPMGSDAEDMQLIAQDALDGGK